jgi:thiol-disulfide isomerase/thioredoxin
VIARLALVTLAVAWLSETALAAELTPPEGRARVGRFTLRTLDGKRVRDQDLVGKVAVVSFWATWCGPCKLELDALSTLAKKHAGAVLFLAVATDGPETRAEVRSVAGRKKWQLTVATDDDGSVTASLNPRGSVPFTLFLDRKARVAATHPGFQSGDEAGYGALLEALRAEP